MGSVESEAEVDAHNAATLWDDVNDHLAEAVRSLNAVESALDDIRNTANGRYAIAEGYAEAHLAPAIRAIERFTTWAEQVRREDPQR